MPVEPSGLAGGEAIDPYSDIQPYTSTHWSAGLGVALVTALVDGSDPENSAWGLSHTVLELTPKPRFSEEARVVPDSYGADGEFRLLGHGPAGPVFAWEMCWDGDWVDVGELPPNAAVVPGKHPDERCARAPRLPNGCEALSGSLELDRLLVRCDDRFGLLPLVGGDSPKLLLRDDTPPTWQWGKQALLLAGKGGVQRFDADGERLDHWPDRTHLPARLDTELGLVLTLDDAGMQVLELDTGKPLVELPLPRAGPSAAAFTQDGSRLAVLDGRVVIHDLRGDEAPRVLPLSEPSSELAWRQDGAVIFLSNYPSQPKWALNVNTGELLDAPNIHGECDPTWRWSYGSMSLTRLLDGATLYLGDEGSVLAEDGRFMGPLDGLGEVHVRPTGSFDLTVDPTPLYELEDELRDEQLLERFIRGEP